MELVKTQHSCADAGHGGNIYKIAEETGIPVESLIDFSASINPLGLPERAKDVIKRELDNLVNYPDPDTKTLRRKIALHHGIDSDTIICGNGSTELIYLVPRALRPGKVLIPSPSFSEYERACKLNYELRITNYELKEENDFRIIPREFIRAMRGCDMAFLCNPNNPTGVLLKREAVLEIAQAAREAKCYLVVDEAFIDFTPEESVIRDVQANPYLIVFRSMTKFYALTGLRIGYGVFHEQVIEKIKKFKEPWTVNSLAQKAAAAVLDDNDYAVRTMELIKGEKDYIEKSLREMQVEYFPSAANFYLLKMKNAGDTVLNLKHKCILVRDCSNFRGLDGSYVRIAVKSRRDNEMLIKELSKLCGA